MSTQRTTAMVPMLMFSVGVLVVAVLVAMIQPGDIGSAQTATTPAAHRAPAAPSTPAPTAPAAAVPSAASPTVTATTATTAPAAVLGNDIERTPSVEDPSRLAHTGGTVSFFLPLALLGLATALYVLLRRTRPQVAATA